MYFVSAFCTRERVLKEYGFQEKPIQFENWRSPAAGQNLPFLLLVFLTRENFKLKSQENIGERHTVEQFTPYSLVTVFEEMADWLLQFLEILFSQLDYVFHRAMLAPDLALRQLGDSFGR